MPNWVGNSLTVIGDAADMKVFYERSIKLEDGKPIWRLSNTIPMPDRLINTMEHSPGKERIQFMNHWEIESAKKQIAQGESDVIVPEPILCENYTIEKSKELIELYGFDFWYDWRIENWGVKWDCATEDDFGWHKEQTDTCYKVYFKSPWSPPCNWLYTMQEMFPSLKFKLRSEEYAMDFSCIFYTNESGRIQWKKGRNSFVNSNGIEVELRENKWFYARTNEYVDDREIDMIRMESTLDYFHVWFEAVEKVQSKNKPFTALCHKLVQACNSL